MTNLRNLFYSCSKVSDKWDRYFDVYQKHFGKFEGKDITFVEVGIQNGGSLEMWSKFFGPNSKIYGIDIDPSCAELKYDNPNIEIIIGPQESFQFWETALKKIGHIDGFLDDGGHHYLQQKITFESVFKNINKNGGVYIVEDCHTSYFKSYDGNLNKPDTFISYAKEYVDVLNYHHRESTDYKLEWKYSIAPDLAGLYFYDSIVVFEKEHLVDMKRVFSLLPQQLP